MTTAEHALVYLREAQAYVKEHGVSNYLAFKIVTSKVNVPCRAVGVAKAKLKEFSWDIEDAIESF